MEKRSIQEIQAWLAAQIASLSYIDPVDIDIRETFNSFGLSSREAVMLSGDLEDWLGMRISPTVVYEYPTIEALAQFLAGEPGKVVQPVEEKNQNTEQEPIAIIGMQGRFPGAANIEVFWQNLLDGVDSIVQIPAERWDLKTLFDPDPQTPGKMYTRWGGFLNHVDLFDPHFFGISPREAVHMDPQQRLLMEVAWESLEVAGIVPSTLAGSNTGVFIGISGMDYSLLQHGDLDAVDAYTGTGGAFSIASNRISYLLDLRGPSISLDTACSSSLYAVHMACQSLRKGDTNLALAGGVNLILSPEANIAFSKAHMMSVTGRCRTFDADADGYVRGEGCGVVVLKRLSDAMSDGNKIFAVIRGTAVNHDGHSNGLTAPNGLAQQEVIRAALKDADLEPGQIGYIEAHGTGTILGDPIEIQALSAVMQDRPIDQPCLVGSVKTNIGHLEAAAGIAGLIKTALILRHGEVPPHLHLKKINPYININEIPITIPIERKPWSPGKNRRYAGVSSFGFGGANAHIILEEAPVETPLPAEVERPWHLLCLSALDNQALVEVAGRYEKFLRDDPSINLADICYSANTTRTHFEQRLAIGGDTTEKVREKLAGFAGKDTLAGIIRGQTETNRLSKIAFLFTGQGAQYAGMGKELYETQPTFRRALDSCADGLKGYLDRPLLDVMFGEGELINQTVYTQPGLFALEYSLGELWRSWGVEPDYVMGHSVGEYVAAVIAGVMSLEDGLKLIALRGKLMGELPHDGEMAAVLGGGQEIQEALEGYEGEVSIAAVNGPRNTVISGKVEGVEQVITRLEGRGFTVKKLVVSHAFHSVLMEPVLEQFEAAARAVKYHPAKIGLVLNVSGKILGVGESLDGGYWRRHIREAVQFEGGMKSLAEAGVRVYIEPGPNPVMVGMGKRCLVDDQALWLPTLKEGRAEWEVVLESLAELYVRGYPVNWSGFDKEFNRALVELPNYPFQRQRYWLEASTVKTGPSPVNRDRQPPGKQIHPLIDRRLRSPAIKETIFETNIDPETISWLGDHRIDGNLLFPATAFFEIALAAADETFGNTVLSLENTNLLEALVIHEGAPCTMQVVFSSLENGEASFQIFSLPPGDAQDQGDWTLNAVGRLNKDRNETPAEKPDTLDLQAIRHTLVEEQVVEVFYQKLLQNGFEYGPAFRGIRQLFRRDGESLGEVSLPEEIEDLPEAYLLHPSLLDACLQTVAATLPVDFQSTGWTAIYLPIGFERYQVYQPGIRNAWCRTVLRSGNQADNNKQPDLLLADLYLVNERGEPLAELTGLRLKRTNRQALAGVDQEDWGDWLYEIQWLPKPLQMMGSGDGSGQGRSKSGIWLIFADQSGVGDRLRDQLVERGEACTLVYAGAEYNLTEPGCRTINPEEKTHFQRLMNDVLTEPGLVCSGVVHLWSLDSGNSENLNFDELEAAQRLGSQSVLNLAQSLLTAGLPKAPQIWLATRGAQPVGGANPLGGVAQSPLWGMGSVIAVEHPELECVRLDLDPLAGPDSAMDIVSEIWSLDGEDQVAFRAGQRYVRRLVKVPQDAWDGWKSPENTDLRLEITERGLIENLTLSPFKRRPPGMGEVEIQVKATGLNFRDVMNVLGLYPGDPGLLGGECSGIVVTVGEGVSQLRPGDAVIAIAPGSFSSYTTTYSELVAPMPQGLTFEEAATIPIAFLTAHYGLNHLARMKAGDKVLIHAASGGVGLAAVQLAQLAGAEVFATAGSPAKREFLESLGIHHIMNSRSVDFAVQIMEETGGQGVDILLNSLSGEFIPKGLSVLAPQGRFLEIGKVGIWGEEQIAELRNDVGYFTIALDDLSRSNPRLIQELFIELIAGFNAGQMNPIHHTVYPIREVASAFRLMAQTRHIGKVVIKQPDLFMENEGVGQLAIRPDEAYLITGGLGGMGLLATRWLVDRGARHLILVERNAASQQAEAMLHDIEKSGARIRVAIVDVTHSGEVTDFVSEMKNDPALPPIKGILHLAGVLDDGAVLSQTWERFERVLAPKVYGAWNLHTATKDLQLDFFVMFSSIASLLGSPGQSNYAAANAFQDALAHYRQANGLKGTAINWGPWASVGMAAGIKRGDQRRLASGGMISIEPYQGLEALDRLVTILKPQVAVAPINWPVFLERFAANGLPPLLAELGEETKRSEEQPVLKKSEVLQRMEGASPNARQDIIIDYLKGQAIKVLGLSPNFPLDIHRPLNEMGLDSIMSIELKNGLERQLGINLPVAILLQGPTIAQLATQLTEQIATPALIDDLAAAKGGPGEYPLSYGQKALWFQHQIAPDSIFNPVYAVRIRSEIDITVIHNAFQALVDRHPALRTTFIARESEPRQWVHEFVPVSFVHQDASTWSVDQINESLAEEANRCFDLEKGPLFRVHLYSLSPLEHILMLSAHHIVVDLWSLALLINELYTMFSSPAGSARLQPLELQYTDFVRWQSERLAGSEGEALWAYWQEKLEGELPFLDLPTDRPRPAVQSYNGSQQILRLDEKLTQKLETLSNRFGVTLYMTMLATFNVLLYRYTGQEDLIVGTPTNGRTRPGMAGITGYFVNPVPIRSLVSEDMTFAELLEQVRQTVVGAIDHQDYPFALLVEKLKPVREPSRLPIFQVMFVLQRAHLLYDEGLSKFAVGMDGLRMNLAGLALESVMVETSTAPLDLTLMMAEADGGLAASITYNTDLFEPITIGNMLGHFKMLLEGIVETPYKGITELPILTEAERHQLLDEWNDTRMDFPTERCVHQLFEAVAASQPDTRAVTFEDQYLTYDELNRHSNQLAHYLQNHGVGPETLVGISIERSMEAVIGLLGILKAGGAYLPLDPNYPRERLAFMLEDSQIPILLTQASVADELPIHTALTICLDSEWEAIAQEGDANLTSEVTVQNLAYVIYTSGSTGLPKGVLLRHRGLTNLVYSQTRAFGVTPNSRVLQFASLSFDASVSEIFMALVTGATLVMARRESLLSVADLRRQLQDQSISTVTLPPSVLALLSPDKLDSLKTVISAGEMCTPEIASRWAPGRNFYNAYGPTEATIGPTLGKVETDCIHSRASSVPIGRPIPNTRIYLLDRHLQPVPRGVPGELYIAGVGLARGYLKRPGLTAERFIPDPFYDDIQERMYKTGDLARYLPDGNIEFMGRVDFQVKIRGFRIELMEVEAALRQLHNIKDAAALVREDIPGDKRLVAYLVFENDNGPGAIELRHTLMDKLPEYMIPTAFVILQSFPKSPNGKVDRKALPIPSIERSALDANFVMPQTEMERTIASIWQDVLGIEKVGIHDNFFDLGGHSLLISKAHLRLQEAVGRELSLVELFRYPTISTLAEYLRREPGVHASLQESVERGSKQKEAVLRQSERMRAIAQNRVGVKRPI